MIQKHMRDSRTAPPLPPIAKREWPFSPFVTALLSAALVVGAVAGAFVSFDMALLLAGLMLAILCLLPVCAGVLWRWWRSRRVAAE